MWNQAKRRVIAVVSSGWLVACGGTCPPPAEPVQPAPDFDAERAYMPYYLVALDFQAANPELFDVALATAFERIAGGLAERDTREVLCISPDGELADAKTAAACDALPGHVVNEVGAGCVIPRDEVAIEEAPKPQRNKPDAELTDAEKKLEEDAKKTGIPKKKYVPNTHDCDDFAYRMHKAVRRLGVKWFSYVKNGRRVGHAVNFVDGPSGRTYLEPQTGEVIILPQPRDQHFESTDPKEIDEKQQKENDREKAGG